MTFTILVLCLVGAVRADRCCYQRDCKNGYYCDGAKLGCSMSASRNGYCKLKNGCCYQKDCIDGHYCDGAKMGCSVSSSKNGKCLAKKTHGAKVGKNSDHKCASGAEQCGYCSKTCKEAGGCRVVPEGEGCTYSTDCKHGHYCEWSAAYLTLFCQGTCTASCKDFTKEDTQEVCQAREAAVIAMAAYDSRKRYCCKEGSNYIKSSEKCCENCEVPREDCVKDSKCTQQCKFYTEVPDKRKGNITPEDYWGFAGALQGFRRHTGTKYMLGKIEGLPFSISGHIGSTVFVSFKGSGADVGDWAANSRTIANKFTAQEWNLGGEQPHLYAHRGFLGYYDTIKVSIFKHVDEMVKEFSATEIHVSGHSLGGGIANIAAVDLAAKYPNVKISLWTFASPRAWRGDTNPNKFGKGLNRDSARNAHAILSKKPNTMHRYLVDGDPVPSLPSERSSFMHTSAGLELNIGDKSQHCSMDYATDKLWGVAINYRKIKSHYLSTFWDELQRTKPAKCGKRNKVCGAWEEPGAAASVRCATTKTPATVMRTTAMTPATTAKTENSAKPVITAKPGVTAKPVTTSKPATTAKPGGTVKPITKAKPGGASKPAPTTTPEPAASLQITDSSSTTNFIAVTLVWFPLYMTIFSSQ